jgi:hypothetical protein
MLDRLRGPLLLLVAIAVWVLPRVAVACPDCPVSRAARTAAAADPDAWLYLAVLLAPFVVVSFAAFTLQRAGRATSAPHQP